MCAFILVRLTFHGSSVVSLKYDLYPLPRSSLSTISGTAEIFMAISPRIADPSHRSVFPHRSKDGSRIHFDGATVCTNGITEKRRKSQIGRSTA
jgi:hypothetical protein